MSSSNGVHGPDGRTITGAAAAGADPSGGRGLGPGGAGGGGAGVVAEYLAAGADVVVPTRSETRVAEFRRVLGDAAAGRLHLVVHDYTTVAGAAQLADEMEHRVGGV